MTLRRDIPIQFMMPYRDEAECVKIFTSPLNIIRETTVLFGCEKHTAAVHSLIRIVQAFRELANASMLHGLRRWCCGIKKFNGQVNKPSGKVSDVCSLHFLPMQNAPTCRRKVIVMQFVDSAEVRVPCHCQSTKGFLLFVIVLIVFICLFVVVSFLCVGAWVVDWF